VGTHNQNLVPGSDNTYDLGTTSARWKDLFLRHGLKLYDASEVIFELDYRGITRCKFEGVATLTPAAVGNPDSVGITFPGVGDDDYYALVTGNGGILVTDTTPQRAQYRLYAEWHAPKPVVGANHDCFTAWVTFHAYNETDNRAAGTWNNFNQMANDLNISTTIHADLARVYWKVIWPL